MAAALGPMLDEAIRQIVAEAVEPLRAEIERLRGANDSELTIPETARRCEGVQ